MADDVETTTFTIAAGDDEDSLTVPEGLLELVSEEGQRSTEAVGDIAMLSMANRVHHMVHHHEGDPDPQLAEIEQATMDLFEERFGVTFAEATGHSH